MSIINQNEEIIREAIGIKNKAIQSKSILTHHHLAKLKYQSPENETYSEAKSQLIIEGWNAEIVITTFVQLLETIIGCSTHHYEDFTI